jgi:hypothetical protein
MSLACVQAREDGQRRGSVILVESESWRAPVPYSREYGLARGPAPRMLGPGSKIPLASSFAAPVDARKRDFCTHADP